MQAKQSKVKLNHNQISPLFSNQYSYPVWYKVKALKKLKRMLRKIMKSQDMKIRDKEMYKLAQLFLYLMSINSKHRVIQGRQAQVQYYYSNRYKSMEEAP